MVVNESATASFQCEADGNPEPEVAWLKQNSSLPADKRVVSSRGGLMITNVTSEDERMYIRVARNILAEMTSSATLTAQWLKTGKKNYFGITKEALSSCTKQTHVTSVAKSSRGLKGATQRQVIGKG